MSYINWLVDFNEFMVDRYQLGKRKEQLLSALSHQMMWAEEASGNRGIKSGRCGENIEYGASQVIDLFGEPLNPLMQRLVMMNTDGHYAVFGPCGGLLPFAEHADRLASMVDDLCAYFEREREADGSIDSEMFCLALRLLEQYNNSDHLPYCTPEDLHNAKKAAMHRLSESTPEFAIDLLEVREAQRDPVIVRRALAAFEPAAANEERMEQMASIHHSVMDSLSTEDLCQLCWSTHGIEKVALYLEKSGRALTEEDMRALMDAAIDAVGQREIEHSWTRADNGVLCGPLFNQFLPSLSVTAILEYLPRNEQATATRKLDEILNILQGREDVSTEDCVKVLMTSKRPMPKPETVLKTLGVTHEDLSRLMLQSSLSFNEHTAACLLISHKLKFAGSMRYQLKDTYLDNLLKAANLDLFSESTEAGIPIAERVQEVLGFMGLCRLSTENVWNTLFYGNKIMHESAKNDAASIVDKFLGRFDKQMERLLVRQAVNVPKADRDTPHLESSL